MGHFLLRAINACYNKGELTESLKRGVITCLPKGNKDKLLLKNWRPISLLNTSYKLASSCIAERLKTVLPDIINEDQTGFISGRYIGENLRILYDVIDYTEKNEIPGMLLLIDFEKAFDSVSWCFLFKVLDFFNFGHSFKQWVKLFYTNIQSCVIVNGHLSDWFYLQRGCRQGDPLSPYLFILCAEILAALIRNNKDINGIKVGNTKYILSQYADDTSILLDGTQKSLEKCMQVLKLYADVSGLCINMEKTKVVWIGSEKNSNRKFCEDYKLCWENKEFIVLGVKFPKKLDDIVELNYRIKIEEMKKVFMNWSKRILTPLGKITVIKSLALSKINHLILALPNPSEKIIKEIQSMFYSYLWNNGPDKIKRSLVTQNYDMGGLRMVDLGMFINSLKLTWLRRILKNTNKYLTTVNELYPFINDCVKYGSAFAEVRRSQSDNKFWRDVIYSFKLFSETVLPVNWYEVLRLPIWYNKNIKVGGAAVFYPNWKDNGILLINDLLDNNGNLVSLEIFQRKFRVHTNFLEFEGLISSVRNYLYSCRFEHFSKRENDPIRPLISCYILKNKKGCRDMYDQFVLKHVSPTSSVKWQNELDLYPNFEWKNVLGLVFKITKDTNLRWFQIRINHRILGTNYLINKMGLKTDDKCTFCLEEKETLKHLFWDCEHVQHFWDCFKLLLMDNCGIENINFTTIDIIFGNPMFDEILNKLLLLGKQFIYRMKIEEKMPSFNAFKNTIALQYKIDKHISVKTQTQNTFEQKWKTYIDLLE